MGSTIRGTRRALVLVLCIAGCLLAPVVAQASASSSWAVNGEVIGESPVAVQGEGQIGFKPQNLAGSISCNLATTGSIWNDGASAKGSLESVTVSGCQSFMLGVCASPKITATNLSWAMDPSEGGQQKYVMLVQGVAFTLVCPEGGLKLTASGGLLHPEVLEGEGGGSYLAFSNGSGPLQASNGGEWYLQGNLPLAGVEGEAITLE